MKKYKLKSQEIVDGLASKMEYLATDQITVEGKQVHYMYQGQPNNNQDSGWRFCGIL